MSKSPKKKSSVAAAKPKPVTATAEVQKFTEVKKAEPQATKAKPRLGQNDSQEGLINFDKKLKWFLGIVIGLFILLTLAKIHYSSIPLWNQIISDGSNPNRGLVSGKPRSIRMDEYAVSTPFMLSQENRGLPIENFTVGGEKAPIVMYLPTKHFVTLFRPDCWGFFFLDTERAYAWWWNFRVLMPLIGIVLLLLLLTNNNFWLSLFGGVWVMLSSGMVWWSYYFSVYIGYASALFVLAAYILTDNNTRLRPLYAVLFAWLSLSFGLALYPPHQIPLIYFILFLFAGYAISKWQKEVLLKKLNSKIVSLLLSVVLIGLGAYLYYRDARSTIEVMTNTVYPGKRSETGGTGFIANYFSEYFTIWLDDTKFPKNWLNICELSHSITFFPIIALCLVLYSSITRKVNWVLLLLSVYIVLGLIWIEIGFPEFLAKVSLMNISPTRRTQVPFGTANVFLTVLYLDYFKDKKITVKPAIYWVAVFGIIAFMVYVCYLNQNDSQNFFKFYQLLISGLLFAALSILLLNFVDVQYKVLYFCVTLLIYRIPNIKANPISKGLSPITENNLYRTVRNIYQGEPNAKWVVIGGQFISYLVAATGVDLLSGVKNQPDFKTMRVLDPSARQDSAYNRYAHTIYNSYIDGKDSVIIRNTFEDGYSVFLDPCSPKLKKLNVKYFIFDHTPQPVEVRCMKSITKIGNIEIYRIAD